VTRVTVELLHILAGIGVAVVIAMLAAWAVPRAAATIWAIDYVAIAGVVLMGIPALMAARAADAAKPNGDER